MQSLRTLLKTFQEIRKSLRNSVAHWLQMDQQHGNEQVLTRDVVNVQAKNFPDLKPNHGTDIKVGMILKHLNFERKECNRGTVYYIVPLTKTA